MIIKRVTITVSLLTLLVSLIALRSMASHDDTSGFPEHSTMRIDMPAFQGQLSWIEQPGQAADPTTVLGIHGTPGSWTAWKALMDTPVVQEHYRFIAVDRPGWGLSQSRDDEVFPQLDDQSRLIETLLQQVSPEQPVILVAHSWGGPVALKLAADFPERIKGLVLIASPADPGVSQPRWYHKLAKAGVVQWMIGDSMSRSNIEMLTLDAELTRLAPQLSNINQPVAVMQGGKDWLVETENANYLAQKLTNAQVQVLIDPKASHFIPFKYPERVSAAIAWVDQQE